MAAGSLVSIADDVSQIQGPWQVKLHTEGTVLRGLDDVGQSILVIVTTQRGTVPHLLEFGIDWLEILDLDMAEARPRIELEVRSAIRRWERRAEVRRVETIADGEHVTVRIVWVPTGSTVERTTEAPIA